MSVSISETIEIDGYCPYLEEDVTIDATYSKYEPLGADAYAVFRSVDCEYAEECMNSSACPVALQRTYW